MSGLLAASWRPKRCLSVSETDPFPEGGVTDAPIPALRSPVAHRRRTVRVSAGAVAYPPDDDPAAALTSEDVPEPVANFVVAPLSPSTDDTVRPYDFSFDPARVGIATREWDFGDGTTSTDACPPHRYDADGEYEVTLRVSTQDGRSDTATRLVRVTTHDVSIAGADVPRLAAAGETIDVAVRVASARYPEMVQVELLRSAGGGPHERVDLLTQAVPAQGEVEFAFGYAVTEGDAAVGSIVFRAVASIVGAADTTPADNSFTAPPTIVH
jgi:PKD repeat protein